MALGIYLNFGGDALAALDFYRQVFDAPEPQVMFFGDMPPDPDHPLPPSASDMVMHASLDIGGENLMFADMPPGMGPDAYRIGNNVCISYGIDDADRLKTLYDRLSGGGRIVMPFGKTFFAEAYAYVIDKFGVTWHLTAEN